MRQFDIFRNPSETSRGVAPFVVALQSHDLVLDTVLVAPLVNDKQATTAEIGVTVEGERLVVALAEMGSVRVAPVSHPVGELVLDFDEGAAWPNGESPALVAYVAVQRGAPGDGVPKNLRPRRVWHCASGEARAL